eukprot:5243310-Lingulodinium_polyedra.AAC.1
MVERLPCAKCRKIFKTEFYCNLLVTDQSFYAPLTEEANHVIRAYANDQAQASSVAQRQLTEAATFRCCAYCAQ